MNYHESAIKILRRHSISYICISENLGDKFSGQKDPYNDQNFVFGASEVQQEENSHPGY